MAADNVDIPDEPPAKKSKGDPDPKPGTSKSEKPSTSKEEKTSSTTDTETPAKRQRINPVTETPQKSTTTGATTENQANQAKKNLGESLGVEATSEAQSITGTSEQQVETTRGPEHNTKGTLQGESGNRKIQKPRITYGIIQVNMTEQTYIFLFLNKEDTDNCCDVFEMHWANSKMLCSEINIKTYIGEEKCVFLCAIQLGFRINWSTLKDRLGVKILDDIYYFQRQTIHGDINDIDLFVDKIKKTLQVCFKNNIQSLDIHKEAEKELAFKNKQSTSTFESAAKRPRWQ